MTGLDLLLAVAGVTVTMLVIAGMILVTPRQVEEAPEVDEQPRPDLRPNPDASQIHSDSPPVALGVARGR